MVTIILILEWIPFSVGDIDIELEEPVSDDRVLNRFWIFGKIMIIRIPISEDELQNQIKETILLLINC